MKRPTLRRMLELGGIGAGAVMIAFGIAAIVLGNDGRSTVRSNLANEYIVGSEDMTPAGIEPVIPLIVGAQQQIGVAREKAGAEKIEFTPVSAPTCSVAGERVDSGSEARCFARYMRIHALFASNGLAYAQMGRFEAKSDAPIAETDFNGGTDDARLALRDEKADQPVANGDRNTWVTQTALASALNLAYSADQISVFAIVVGIALLLSGIGFVILAVAVLHRPTSAGGS